MSANNAMVRRVIIGSVLLLAILSSQAVAIAKFVDKPIDGFFGATGMTLHVEIKGGVKYQTVRIEWEQPPGTSKGTKGHFLDANGNLDYDWCLSQEPALADDCLELYVMHEGEWLRTDTDFATWVSGGSKIRVAKVSAISSRGLILLTVLLFMLGGILIAWRRRAFQRGHLESSP